MPDLRLTFILATMLAVPSVSSLAQPPATPLEKAVESKVDAPATITPRPPISDPDIEQIVGMLTGSFSAESAGDRPGLRLNSTAMTVDGLDNAVYFEITRADAPAAAFRQGVFHLYRFKNELRLRVFDIAGNPGLRDTLTGLWAAPEALPALTAANLDPNLDLTMSKAGNGWLGSTAHAFPVARDGAVEMTATIAVRPGELRMTDTGFGSDGKPVWGEESGKPSTVFHKTAAPGAMVNRMEGGLTVITLVPPTPDAPQLVENGQVAVQYTGWLTDGSRFDSSRQPGREAFMLRVPGPVIKGWNEGLKGIAKGERRRLIIPPTLAYGERGTRDGRIPPNSTLIFDVECVYLDNTQPAAPAAAAVPVSPHGAAPQTPPPQPPPQPGTATPPPAESKPK